MNTDFSRDDYNGAPMTDLVEIINHVRPTALLGLSTITVGLAGRRVYK
jgi:malate dehydrogenase (oxaloacetate-decarboxylating)(NADP+)